ncbi:MAG: hypothetical protein DRO88_10660 [Promethearchaeia archaeon]|nr:MAG: hypothetical protein DRO88_10660 [Candidatus Lokiarchaeia archaeon]
MSKRFSNKSTHFVRKVKFLPIYIPPKHLNINSQQKLEEFFQKTLSSFFSWKIITSLENLRQIIITHQCSSILIHNAISKEKFVELHSFLKNLPVHLNLFLLTERVSSDEVSYYLHHGINGAINFPFKAKDLDLLFHTHIHNCIYEID